MFAPPPTIVATPFARLPDSLRIRTGRSRWSALHHGERHFDCFLEGPAFDRAGNLLMVDIAWGRVLSLSPAGEFSVIADYDGAPNGLAIHRDGRVFIADWFGGILVLDPKSGMVTPVMEGFAGRPFAGVNDLAFALNGDLYFTDQGMSGLHAPEGRLFRLGADGHLALVLDRIPSPNGLAMAADQRTVFLNVTRDNAVWRVPLDGELNPYKVGAFVQLSGGIGPDGLALDAEGGLAIAHVGMGAVWLCDARGVPRLRIDAPAGLLTTNLAFGGSDGRMLYITESETGTVLTADAGVAGLGLFSHA